MLRYLSAFWGVVGVSSLLLIAIYRLVDMMLNAMHVELGWGHIIAIAFSVLFMAYTEGYRGFQQRFSPRVAARVLYLSKDANCINGVFAPLFCMGYFGTTPRRQFTAIFVSCMIVVLVSVVREIPQPWRFIIDAGVVAGLAWGVISFWAYIWIAFSNKDFAYSAELPEHYETSPE
jgi:hypothetical protein